MHPDRFLSLARRAHLRAWGVQETAREVLFTEGGDGWHVALSRYGRRRARKHPVLLVPGLAANRFTFDLAPEVSHAAHLGRLGFDVFTLELRGHGRSEAPRPWSAWGFHDYVDYDLPAALDRVLEVTGAQAVHGIGHSMGGIGLLGRVVAGDPRVRSVATLGSSVDYSGTPSVFRTAVKALFLTYVIPAVPLGAFASTMAPIALAFPNPIDAGNVHHRNVDRELYRRLTAVGFHSIRAKVLRDLAAAVRPGGIADAGGRRYAEVLSAGDVPVLAIAGSADVQCSPEAAERHGELRVFGRSEGHREDYGHFDLIMGSHAAQEVWPTLEEWLLAHE